MIGMGAVWRARVEASPPMTAIGHISMLLVDCMSALTSGAGHGSRAGQQIKSRPACAPTRY